MATGSEQLILTVASASGLHRQQGQRVMAIWIPKREPIRIAEEEGPSLVATILFSLFRVAWTWHCSDELVVSMYV